MRWIWVLCLVGCANTSVYDPDCTYGICGPQMPASGENCEPIRGRDDMETC